MQPRGCHSPQPPGSTLPDRGGSPVEAPVLVRCHAVQRRVSPAAPSASNGRILERNCRPAALIRPPVSTMNGTKFARSLNVILIHHLVIVSASSRAIPVVLKFSIPYHGTRVRTRVRIMRAGVCDFLSVVLLGTFGVLGFVAPELSLIIRTSTASTMILECLVSTSRSRTPVREQEGGLQLSVGSSSSTSSCNIKP
jgi:hypothetical protein